MRCRSGCRGWLQLIGGSGRVVDGPGAELPLGQGDGLGFGAPGLGRFVAGADGADLLLFELR